MADGDGAGERKVHVFTSGRMADRADPGDVIHGKRFTDPATGKPASIADILADLGVIGPDPGGPKDEEPPQG